MYGYTMHIPAPIGVYHSTHKAVLEVMDEEGGGEGLILPPLIRQTGGST